MFSRIREINQIKRRLSSSLLCNGVIRERVLEDSIKPALVSDIIKLNYLSIQVYNYQRGSNINSTIIANRRFEQAHTFNTAI